MQTNRCKGIVTDSPQQKKLMRHFNTTGNCNPAMHYMVDISARLAAMKSMVDNGQYICLNRGRQYGKTTLLKGLAKMLRKEYAVFSLSFEDLADSAFVSAEKLCAVFLWMMRDAVANNEVEGLSGKAINIINGSVDDHASPIDTFRLTSIVNKLCQSNERGIVVIIDEVDQAGNSESFIKFLGILRKLFLGRDSRRAFQSVILAGVYDIKNMKMKMRSEEEHQYNSPWNIATTFDEEMAFSPADIESMLKEYAAEHNAGIDIRAIANTLYEYTSGYPFLVSRLCQLLDAQSDWSSQGVLKAVKAILTERNTLFDDMIKKMEQHPRMKQMLADILFRGEEIAFNAYDASIEIAAMFNFIVNDCGTIRLANRLFETHLYNYFASVGKEEDNGIYRNATQNKPDFVDGEQLNMPIIMARFAETFNDLYGQKSESFLEEEGRRLFLLYIRPIINGVGNYYIEAQTRDHGRTDIIIDYKGKQYIIELKIWHGDSYNKRGEQQLVEYMEYFHASTAYMLSFCFNKTKVVGLRQPLQIGKHTLIEAIV